ncbi:hypothetical protein [Ramlibacter alkalitolerans]|uniref:Uncharacterized protein n=1 Tax=Ramlibacter alkalitolerans TaxID=2039631 RepID=A0ABS1JTV0_9BURK|nr:hypothetical protein [Ramlibacter alkalitolerans]MBL0427720.1 hypothetical protein [Ramlibacter alkalitolerans]
MTDATNQPSAVAQPALTGAPLVLVLLFLCALAALATWLLTLATGWPLAAAVPALLLFGGAVMQTTPVAEPQRQQQPAKSWFRVSAVLLVAGAVGFVLASVLLWAPLSFGAEASVGFLAVSAVGTAFRGWGKLERYSLTAAFVCAVTHPAVLTWLVHGPHA